MIEQGYPRFGERAVTEKRDLVFEVIHHHLVMYPRTSRDPQLGLCVYAVSKTPFVLLYDYDDVELRILFVVHKRADLRQLDPTSAEW